jgi:pseudouridine synthase
VTVNGRATRQPDLRVDEARDRVRLDGKPLVPRTRVYLLLHKPAGYVTTYRDPEGRRTVYDLLKEVTTFVSPVGRLDRETSGLLLMTNDTAFADRVTSPESHVPKTYVVKASALLSETALQTLRDGVTLRDGPTRPAAVTWLNDEGKRTSFEITLTEGRNRQVRRMVEAAGARVVALTRTRIGAITLDGTPPGRWRPLTPREIRALGNG